MKKNLLIAGAAAAGLVVVALIALPFVVDANQFRGTLEADMTSALGRKVTVGHLKVSLFSGGIAVDDIAIADDPAFGAAPFVTAKAVNVGVEWLPLIFSRQVRVRSFRLVDPNVVLLRSPAGHWNFSSLGAASAAGGSTAAANLSVQTLSIANGQVAVGMAGKQRQYDNVTLEATGLSYGSQFPFRLTMRTPGSGTIGLTGTVGPLNAKDAAETPFQAALEVKNLDLASTGFIDPASGMAGLIDVTSTVTSDGHRVTSKGTVHATKLQMVQGGAPARVPIEIEYETAHDISTERGSVTRGDVHAGKALAHLSGDYNTHADPITVHMKLTGDKMPASEVEATLPAIGVTLPSGASLQEGTVDADLLVSGPVDHLVTTGPVHLSNAKLKGFDLAGKMGAVASFAGLPKGSDTLIQTLSSTLRVAPDGVRTESLSLIVAAVGTLTGSGTIAPGGAMDYRMIAKLNNASAIGNTVSQYASLGHPENGVPFRIAGTTANPVFMPDVGGMLENAVKSPEAVSGAVGLLQGLFKKK